MKTYYSPNNRVVIRPIRPQTDRRKPQSIAPERVIKTRDPLKFVQAMAQASTNPCSSQNTKKNERPETIYKSKQGGHRLIRSNIQKRKSIAPERVVMTRDPLKVAQAQAQASKLCHYKKR